MNNEFDRKKMFGVKLTNHCIELESILDKKLISIYITHMSKEIDFVFEITFGSPNRETKHTHS